MWNSQYPLSIETSTKSTSASIDDKITNYSKCPQLLHTIFNGPEGSGKYFQACKLLSLHFRIPLTSLYKKRKFSYEDNEKEYFYLQSSFHFEIDVTFYNNEQQEIIIEIIMELSKSKNVSNNRYQVIFLKNADYLDLSTQHQLRKLMESFYSSCRIFFFTHNISCIDDTIQSRSVLITIPSPSETFVKETLDAVRERQLKEKKATQLVPIEKVKLYMVENKCNLHSMILNYQFDTSQTFAETGETDVVPNQSFILDKYVSEFMSIIEESKAKHNPMTLATSLRQLIRDCLVTCLPVDTVISKVVRHIVVTERDVSKIGKVMTLCCEALFHREQGYKDDFYLEYLFVSIVLVLQDGCQKK
jgi:hypothetical protein